MQLITPFDATGISPEQGVPSLPIGKHPVVIVGSEVKATQNNDGGYLQLTLRIIDGPMTGTEGAYRLNLYNSSQKAVEIAQKQMSAVCHVTGVFKVSDSQQLHNIPFIVEVGFQKGQEPGAPDSKGYTEVKRVFDSQGNEPGKQGQGQGAAAQPQGQTNGGFAQTQQAPQNQNGGFNQQQQQQQQQPQSGGNPGWGGAPNGGAAEQPAQTAQWGNQQQQQQSQAPANNGGNWNQQQQAPQGGAPAWAQNRG